MIGSANRTMIRCKAPAAAGVGGFAGLGISDPISSLFKSKSSTAKAEAQAATAQELARQRTLREIGLAKVDALSSSRLKRWTPTIVLGAVVVAGFIVYAASRRKRRRP